VLGRHRTRRAYHDHLVDARAFRDEAPDQAHRAAVALADRVDVECRAGGRRALRFRDIAGPDIAQQGLAHRGQGGLGQGRIRRHRGADGEGRAFHLGGRHRHVDLDAAQVDAAGVRRRLGREQHLEGAFGAGVVAPVIGGRAARQQDRGQRSEDKLFDVHATMVTGGAPCGYSLPSRLEGAPVLDRFRDMLGRHVLRAAQVGHRARYLEHAVVGARRPVQLLHRGAQQAFAGRVRAAVAVDLARRQALVRLALARQLQRMRLRHACGDRGAALAFGQGADALRRHGRHCQLDVDAVEQGAGDAVLVALRAFRRAAAFAGHVSEPAAGAGVHRRHQLEASRKVGLVRRARDRDLARLERLAQHFQHAPVELRQFVEEEHAVVGQRDLARTRRAPAVNSTKRHDFAEA